MRLFANHAAHVAFCHREVVHNRAVLTRGVNRYLHRVLIFHKATGNGNQQFLHVAFLRLITGCSLSSAEHEQYR